MNKKNLLKNILFTLITVLIFLFLLELILRIFGYFPLKSLLKDRGGRHLILQISKNKDLKYELTPHAQGFSMRCKVKINSRGFRDEKEYELQKKDKYRIIAIGDSITFGVKLPLSATYAKQLEKMFNPGNRKVEVLNMGCGGYDILQAVTMLEDKGLQFSPDLVVYGFCLNDLVETSPSLAFIRKMAAFKDSWLLNFRLVQFVIEKLDKRYALRKLLKNREKRKQVDKEAVEKNSKYINLVKNDRVIDESIKQISSMMNETEGKNQTWLAGFTMHSRLGMMRYSFGKLAKLAQENNFRVIVVIIPWLDEDEYYLPVHNLVKQEAGRFGFVVLDLYEKMKDYGLQRLRILEKDISHPNKEGHEIIASSLYDYIVGENLIK